MDIVRTPSEETLHTLVESTTTEDGQRPPSVSGTRDVDRLIGQTVRNEQFQQFEQEGNMGANASTTAVASASTGDGGDGLEENNGEIDRNEPSDVESLLSSRSEETLHNDLRVFGHNATTYRVVREMPVVSSFMQSGVQVFGSHRSLEAYLNRGKTDAAHSDQTSEEGLGTPLLQTNTSVLSIFKKNAPFMIINRFTGPDSKEEFCRVNFKILATNLTCWVLTFNLRHSTEIIVLMNNGIRPSVDFHWRDTRCRITGVSGTTSTFGNGLFKTYIMSPEAVLSCNNLQLLQPGKTVKVKVDKSNPLCKSIINHDRTSVNSIMAADPPLFHFPVCSYIDAGSVKLQGKLIKNGSIKIFDRSTSEITESTLVLASILLVLREQEHRKNRGNSKPC